MIYLRNKDQQDALFSLNLLQQQQQLLLLLLLLK
jgi:hypothetical protein